MEEYDRNPLYKRGVWLLENKFDNPWELFKFWSAAGVWRRYAPWIESTGDEPWYLGLDGGMRHPYS